MKRLRFALFLCVLLGAFAGTVFAQDVAAGDQQSVLLKYKFTPGELLRYKMTMNMNIKADMPNMPEGATVPDIAVKMTMVMRQRTKSVLANGDAEINQAIESMTIDLMGQTQTLPTNQMPVITTVMSPNGSVKKISGLEKLGGMFNTMPMMNPSSIESSGMGAVLPTTAIKVGDTWSQEIPFPMGKGKMTVNSKLLSATATVANVSQDVTGDLDMPMPVPAGVDASSMPKSMKMAITTNGNITFASDKGQVTRSQGTMHAVMTMGMPSESGEGGSMKMDMSGSFDMNLISAGK